jgi:hypothetical protein
MNQTIETLLRQAKSGDYEVHGNTSEGDCIIGFSFGYVKHDNTIEPGKSNEDLARYIKENSNEKPLILQFEISNVLQRTASILYEVKEHRNKGEYLGTDEVAKQALEIMKKHEWSKAILIAHPFHMPRVDAVCKKLGITTIVPSGLDTISFDPKSEQEWTRNKHAWGIREDWAIHESVKLGLI